MSARTMAPLSPARSAEQTGDCRRRLCVFRLPLAWRPPLGDEGTGREGVAARSLLLGEESPSDCRPGFWLFAATLF